MTLSGPMGCCGIGIADRTRRTGVCQPQVANVVRDTERRPRVRRRLAIVMSLAAFSCTARGPEAGPGLAQALVGSWRLVSAEGHGSDGGVTYEWGPQPLGQAMFNERDRMSIHLVNPARPIFASGDFLQPTPEELRTAWSGYFGYFGRYSVDEAAETVTFHVEGAAYPNYIGTDQQRFLTIEGNRLTLRTPPERAGGVDVTYFVTFEREN